MATIRSVNVANGGFVTSDETEGICLKASVTASANYDTFHLAEGAAGYDVPAGKILYITRIMISGDVGSAVIIGYADDNEDDGAVITNPINMTEEIYSTAGSTQYGWSVHIPIPATKFPFILGAGAAGGNKATIFGVVK